VRFDALILAGGKSSRMGRDKAFLEIAGQTLLSRQIRIAKESGAADIFVSGRTGTDYSAFGCRVVADRFAEAGPLAGIEAALAKTQLPLLLVLAVDLPEMDSAFVRRLTHGRAEDIGVIPRVANLIEPLAAIYPRRSKDVVQAMLEDGKFAAQEFARNCVEGGLAIFNDISETDARRFKNLNCPADLRLAH
jgi:molybdopterin-guanine dinucleotide biosynthesis protein A